MLKSIPKAIEIDDNTVNTTDAHNSTVNDDSDDSGTEFIIIPNRHPRLISQTTGLNNESSKHITHFENMPLSNYTDHTSPFRGILSQRNASDEDKAKQITDLFLNDKDKKLLVVTSGKNHTGNARRTFFKAIEFICGPDKVTRATLINQSHWSVVEMKSVEDRKKLLSQKVIYDPYKRTLVIFRGIKMRPTNMKIFELQDMRYAEDLDEIRNVLTETKVEVSKIKKNIKT